MITITSVKIETNPYYEPEMHFEGVLNLDTAKTDNMSDDEFALMIGKEFLKHVIFVSKITEKD